ncbi:MAG: PAS-domain containing protein, partial [Sneathiella sp.]|nr:PAS-domain containing protein [Sneathiella sp.]
MEKPTLPAYEEQRLAALHSLDVLDSHSDEGFDRLTRLIKAHFNVPIVLVSLIDEDREWIKSKQGTDCSEIPREYSFCAHAILEDDIFYVSDTLNDPRFVDNPYVTHEPFIRFYAAVPVTVEGGLKIGALSLMDTKPRDFTYDQIASLKDFGECVELQLVQSRLRNDANYLVSQTSRLNTLLETVADGIVTIDDNSNIESLNTQAAHIFGYEPYEILGQDFNKMIPDLGCGGWDGYIADFFDENRLEIADGKREVMGRRKNGSLFPIDLSVRVMFLHGKRLYTGIIRDVTDRKAVEDELKRGQQLLEVTKENVPVGISVFDNNQNLVVINQEVLSLFDLPEEFAQLGISYSAIIRYCAERGDYGGGDIDSLVEERVRIGLNPEPQRFLRSVNSGNRTIEVNTRPMPGGGVVSICLDITERLRSEEKLEKLLYQANSANKAKSDFLSMISHEIRTPLNGVLGVARMLGDTRMDEGQRSKLNIILKSGNTLLELINGVLDMSKIETGNLELEYIPCDLRDIVSSLIEPFEITARNKGVEFNCDICPNIAAYHIADSTRLRQVVMNLLSNALKFTDNGSVALSLRTHEGTEEDTQNISISVEDTGVGIPEDRLSSVFDSFSQADSSVARKYGGTGLGLSIVKNLVTLMDGNISLMSVIGVGSCFEVTLQFVIASEEEVRSINGIELICDESVKRSLTILVADDNEVNAMITMAFLKKLGHMCHLAENGLEALHLLDEEEFDLILMDVHMPEMDGIEATKIIRSRDDCKSLPIIGVTADAFMEHHSLYREIGMDDVLTKPFTVEQL